MGNNASAQAAFDKARDKAQNAVEAATGGLTKCMSKDTRQVATGEGDARVTRVRMCVWAYSHARTHMCVCACVCVCSRAPH